MTDPFSVAGSAVGVISLGLTVCQGLLDYYGSWKDYSSDIEATFNSLAGLTSTLRLLEATINRRHLDPEAVVRVQESIISCEDGIGNLERKLKKVQGIQLPSGLKDKLRSQARRAIYPFKTSTLSKLEEIVLDLRDNLSLAVQTLQM
jgi:ankyrin repeat domain-containing protein 50